MHHIARIPPVRHRKGQTLTQVTSGMQDRVEQIYHHRRHSSGRILPDGAVSVSVNGGIAALTKSPDAEPDMDGAETPEDTFGAAPHPQPDLCLALDLGPAALRTGNRCASSYLIGHDRACPAATVSF